MTPTSPEVEAIRLRCAKATKPPWRTSPTWTNFAGMHCVIILAGQHADPGDDDALAAVLGGVPSEWQANNNAEFMAHAQEDIPLLLSALLDAARQIEGLKKRLALALMELGRVPDPRFTGPTISVINAARKADSMFAAEPMRALTPAEIDAATDAHAARQPTATPPP